MSKLTKTFFIAITAFLLSYAFYQLFLRIYDAGHTAGTSAENARWLEIEQRWITQGQSLQAQTQTLQQELNTSIAQNQTYQESLNHVQTSHDDLLNRVERGDFRVYIPAKCTTTDFTRTNSNTANRTTSFATGNGGERCELDEQTFKRLTAITNDGDKAIIERNECIRRYNAAQAALTQANSKAKQTQ